MLGSVYVSYKLFKSASLQAYLMADYNNQTFDIKYEYYAQALDANFPNLTQTVLPLKYIQARYFLRLDSIDKAKSLLYEAIQDNPFIKAPEEMLARAFIKENNLDSAFYYSKDAFDKMPNANPHRFTYFRLLRHFKDSTKLDRAFDLIKERDNVSNWYDYIASRFDITQNARYTDSIIKLFEEKFPNEDTFVISQMKNLVSIGSESYTLSTLISQEADKEYLNENYARAAQLYEYSIGFNDQRYLDFENAAISYDLSENYDRALKYYDRVIYEFKSQTGRAEFYKGLMLIKLDNLNEGCKYMKRASEKRYATKTGIIASNVFISLCSANQNN